MPKCGCEQDKWLTGLCRRSPIRHQESTLALLKMITTTKGPMDESLLEKKTGEVNNDLEHTTWVEYWLKGELVHRSVHMTLKEGAISPSVSGVFG